MCLCEGSTFRTFYHQILTFLKRIFSGKVQFEANRKNNNDCKEIRGHASRKFFENLHTVMGILALFEQFVTQIFFFCP